MPKIAWIGAGSVGFTRKLFTDILSFEALRETEFAFMDIDEERLDVSKQLADKLLEQKEAPVCAANCGDKSRSFTSNEVIQ